MSCLGGYGLVFGGNFVFSAEISYVWASSSDIYTENSDLSSTLLIYKSNSDLSGYTLYSSCNISGEFIESYKNLYFFSVDYSNAPDCKNGNVILEYEGAKVVSSLAKLKLHTLVSKLNTLLDYSDHDLNNLLSQVEAEIGKYAIYKNYNGKEISKNYSYLKGKRKYLEALQQKWMIDEVIEGRKEKYMIPVVGSKLSTKFTKMPNSPRPYRASYTDGIHHGWDFDSANNAQSISLDDGIVIRVVDSFDDSDFNRIVYGTNLSYEQELKNLDILRGKQVWIKTMKGDVGFYSHLSEVDPSIKEGMKIEKGQVVGTVWVTGVPEKWYDDYHLHFPIMQNPYNKDLAGTYDYGEIMAWDWLGMHKSHNELLEYQNTVFE